MVKLDQFSNKNFEKAQPFTPTYPDSGDEIKGVTLWVKSSKSRDALPIIDSATSEALIQQLQMQKTGQVKVNTLESEQKDIELACAVLTKFEGIADKNGEQIESTPESIKALMTDYDWLRSQVLTKANTATFFYKSE